MGVECQNCGTEVSNEYARVLEKEKGAGPEACPWCPDKMWRNGRVEEARGTRRCQQ